MDAEIGAAQDPALLVTPTIQLTLNDLVAIDFVNPHNSLRDLLLVQLMVVKFERVGVELETCPRGSLHIREVLDPLVLCEVDWNRGDTPLNLDERKTRKLLAQMITKLVEERT